jgi:hypothetical protein
MMLPPIFLTLIYLLTRRWPKWMEKRAGLPVIAFHDCVMGYTTDCDGGW